MTEQDYYQYNLAEILAAKTLDSPSAFNINRDYIDFVDKLKLTESLYEEFSKKHISEKSTDEFIIEIYNKVIKDHVRQNIESAAWSLTDKGLLKSVVTESGELGFVLNDKKNDLI